MPHENIEKKSSAVLILVAWAVVVLPTAWGLNYTVQNALKIFTRTSAASTGTPSQVK